MEKRRFIPAAVLIVFVLCYSIASAGEKAVYDRDYNLRYHIDDSGQIYDRDYNRKGRVEGNKVYDENYKLKYRIEGTRSTTGTGTLNTAGTATGYMTGTIT